MSTISNEYQLNETPELIILNDDIEDDCVAHVTIIPENPESIYEYSVCNQTDLDGETFQYSTTKGTTKTTHQLKHTNESWYLVLKCKSIIKCKVNVDCEIISTPPETEQPQPPPPPPQQTQLLPKSAPAQLRPPKSRASNTPRRLRKNTENTSNTVNNYWFNIDNNTLMWICLGLLVGVAMSMYFGWPYDFFGVSSSSSTSTYTPSSNSRSITPSPSPSIMSGVSGVSGVSRSSGATSVRSSAHSSVHSAPKSNPPPSISTPSVGTFVDELRTLPF